jgi:MPBQ/MSBQ methyltransferase
VNKKKYEHISTYHNDIALKLAHKMFGLEHLHYGYFEKGDPVLLENLNKAQNAYVEKLLDTIPDNVKTILDVGCGTGGVAKQLVEKKYDVTCIAPDPYLIDKTLENTGGNVKTHTDLYENIQDFAPESFDLILMSESCQYIKPDPGWEQNKKILKKGGYYLVADFFKIRPIDNPSMSKSGQPLDNFLERAEKANFKLLKKIDITPNVAPTMDLYQEILNVRLFPLLEAANEFVLRRFPFIHKILKFFLEKKVIFLVERYKTQNAENWVKYKGYFIFLFQKQ